MSDAYEGLETGIKGFTYDDAYNVVLNAREPVVTAPENMSGAATVSGPSNAAQKSRCDLKRFLYQ